MENYKIAISCFEVGEYVEVECDGDKTSLAKVIPMKLDAWKKYQEKHYKGMKKGIFS